MHTTSAPQFQPFPFTVEGYRSACAYLRQQGRAVDEKPLEVLNKDGETVIQLTNDIRQLKGHYMAHAVEYGDRKLVKLLGEIETPPNLDFFNSWMSGKERT